VVATLVVVFVLTGHRIRTITAVAGTVLLIGATIGMVGLGYHYATDIPGGTLFAVSAVLAVRGLQTRLRP
jgi:hypothetical protein